MHKTIARGDLLIIDDCDPAVLAAPERRDLLEIVEDSHDRASTIVKSQLPVKHGHMAIGDPNQADAILGSPRSHCTQPRTIARARPLITTDSTAARSGCSPDCFWNAQHSQRFVSYAPRSI
jgi:hypothetical protein